MSKVTISFQIDSESIISSLSESAESFGMKVRDDLTASELANVMSGDVENHIMSSLTDFFFDGINNDCYSDCLED